MYFKMKCYEVGIAHSLHIIIKCRCTAFATVWTDFWNEIRKEKIFPSLMKIFYYIYFVVAELLENTYAHTLLQFFNH